MPSQTFTSSGSWTAPFACRNVTATAIGGGGSGYKDKTDNEDGGGGGGGGFARSTRSVPGGNTLTITVGSGGGQPGNNNSNRGGLSQVSGLVAITANGGAGGSDGQGGDGASGVGDTTGSGQNGTKDSDNNTTGGEGGGAGRPGGNSGRCGNSNGGQGTNLDGSQGGCTGGKRGGTYGGGGAGNTDGGEAGAGGDGAVLIEWDYFAPTIGSFTASTQTSGTTGVPSDDITLNWSTTYANSVSINQGVGGVGAGGPITINSGLQSVAGSSSPATRIYTLTATGPGGTVTATATASVYNDNTPNSLTIPSTTTSGTSLSSLEPNTTYVITVGPVNGIDMITAVNCNTSGLQASVGGSSYSSTIYISSGNTISLRFTSQPFSTTPTGATNSRTYSFSVGTASYQFTATTRAPDVNETFDFGDNETFYPYPDIDINPAAATQYMQSPTTITVNDVEIPVELRVNTSSTEVRIKKQGDSVFGSWLPWT
jgi:hypothetical protein